MDEEKNLINLVVAFVPFVDHFDKTGLHAPLDATFLSLSTLWSLHWDVTGHLLRGHNPLCKFHVQRRLNTKVDWSKIHKKNCIIDSMLWCCKIFCDAVKNVVNVAENVANVLNDVVKNDCRFWCEFLLPKCWLFHIVCKNIAECCENIANVVKMLLMLWCCEKMLWCCEKHCDVAKNVAMLWKMLQKRVFLSFSRHCFERKWPFANDSTLQFQVVLRFGQMTQCTAQNLRAKWSRPLALALGIPESWHVEFCGPVHGQTLVMSAIVDGNAVHLKHSTQWAFLHALCRPRCLAWGPACFKGTSLCQRAVPTFFKQVPKSWHWGPVCLCHMIGSPICCCCWCAKFWPCEKLGQAKNANQTNVIQSQVFQGSNFWKNVFSDTNTCTKPVLSQCLWSFGKCPHKCLHAVAPMCVLHPSNALKCCDNICPHCAQCALHWPRHLAWGPAWKMLTQLGGKAMCPWAQSVLRAHFSAWGLGQCFSNRSWGPNIKGQCVCAICVSPRTHCRCCCWNFWFCESNSMRPKIQISSMSFQIEFCEVQFFKKHFQWLKPRAKPAFGQCPWVSMWHCSNACVTLFQCTQTLH